MNTLTETSRSTPLPKTARLVHMENGIVEKPISFSDTPGGLTLIDMTFQEDVTFAGHVQQITIKNCLFKGKVLGHLVSESISLHGSNAVLCTHTPGLPTILCGSAVKEVFAVQADT